jgi:hypothetical protein
MASTTAVLEDNMERLIKRQSAIPSTDDLQDYVLQKTSTTGNAKVPYRILRLDAVAGVNAKEAIGMLVAGKTGAKVVYSRQDLRYDLNTQVIKLVRLHLSSSPEGVTLRVGTSDGRNGVVPSAQQPLTVTPLRVNTPIVVSCLSSSAAA